VVDFYREILESAKPTQTLILGCNTIGHLGAGLMHLNRTGDDTSGVSWERTLRLGVNTLAFRMPQHRTFYDADADCLGITEQIPWRYNRLWGDLLAKSGTSLFVSAKPGVLTEDEEKELAGFLEESSRQEQIAEPLDWEETTLPQRWRSGDRFMEYDWYEETEV
jgi:alpha-galactosidase